MIDADGLSLETPIRGTIRIRPDRPPTGSAEVVHKVVLPTAEPVIEYRASDDYGLSRARARSPRSSDSIQPAPSGPAVDLGQGSRGRSREAIASGNAPV